MDERQCELRDPFSTSSAPSIQSAVSPYSATGNKRPFKSHLLDGEYERPWIKDKRLQRTRVGNYIIWGFVVLALALSAYYNYAETRKVPKYEVGSAIASRSTGTLTGLVLSRSGGSILVAR